MNVSMLAFFQTGLFGNLTLGKTKEWVRDNFSFPDGDPSLKAHKRANIWLYGNIEFHFHENELYLIHCDHVSTLNGGHKIDLDKWIFEDPTVLYLPHITKALTKQQIAFSSREVPHFQQIELTLMPSKVKLFFDDTEPFSLFALSLMR